MFIMETNQRYNRTLGIYLLPMNDYFYNFIKYFFKTNIKKIYFYKPVWKSIAVLLSTFLLLFFSCASHYSISTLNELPQHLMY